jgi:hypothetical protein
MTAETGFKRASDTLLKWALGLVGVGLISAIALLLDIRVSLAVYQADNKAMKEQITDLKAWQLRHDQDDRARLQSIVREPR